MTLVLSETVHATPVGDDLVLLDVAADAYFCLPDGARRLCLQADRRSFSPVDQDSIAALIEARLVHDAIQPPLARPRIDRPGRGLSHADATRLTFREWIRLGLCLLDAVAGYWRRPFPDILATAARSRRPNKIGAEAATVRLAAGFRRVAIWLPISGKCLLRSYVLLRFLQRSGVGADWVIAVRTWPFGSHCWLQVGDVVLDDLPERLSAYEPILAVAG